MYRGGGWTWVEVQAAGSFDAAWWQTILYNDVTFALFTVLLIGIGAYYAIRAIAKSKI
jgi:hypothetical protein